MKKIFLLVLLSVQFSLLAQNYKFGKVSKEEVKEKFYPLDSTADAVYLFKKRRSYYKFMGESGFQLVTDYQERLKIYSKEGFEMATKTIPYYYPEVGDPDKISAIKGYTFNLKGNKLEKVKLSSKDIFKETLSKFTRARKITMPNIKEGTVIELKYTLISPYIQSVSDFQFQYNIPVKKLEYQLEVPEYFTFSKKSKGYYPVKMTKKGKTGTIGDILYNINIFKFDEENIPALKDDEPFVSSVRNYRAGMKFELSETNFIAVGGEYKTYTNSWNNVSQKIYKTSSFGGEIAKSNYYKEDLEKILAKAKTESHKIGAIFQFVKQKVKWNEYYGIYSDKGVKKAYKERVGNVADINLILTSMLRSAGLSADPVLVSTRSNGVPFSPTIDGFDYLVTVVDLSSGGYILLDATEPYSIPNILPTRALNWNGRRIKKGGYSSWVKLTSSKPALEETRIMATLSDDMMLEGVTRTKYFNLRALTYRRNHNHLTEETIINSIEDNHNIEIESFKQANKNNIGKPLVRSLKFTSEDLVEEINGKIYIEPLLFKSIHNNPFKLEERKFPVDFTTPWQVKNVVSLKIPEGYKVASLPKSLAIGLPENLGSFQYKIVETSGKIETICLLKFNNAVISSKYYGVLKDFYSQLVKKESEKVVLVKI